MTTEVKSEGEMDISTKEVSTEDNQESIESLRAQVASANAEAAKLRKIKNDLAKERDTLKHSKSAEESANWETLYKQSQEELGKIKDSTKKQAITAAIKESLIKQGILPDAISDAAKLVDQSIISWDVDEGIDSFSVDTAVKSLRSSSKYLFENKISPTVDPKNPKNGNGKNANEMTRTEFMAIADPKERAKVALKFKIVD